MPFRTPSGLLLPPIRGPTALTLGTAGLAVFSGRSRLRCWRLMLICRAMLTSTAFCRAAASAGSRSAEGLVVCVLLDVAEGERPRRPEEEEAGISEDALVVEGGTIRPTGSWSVDLIKGGCEINMSSMDCDETGDSGRRHDWSGPNWKEVSVG